MEKAGVGQRVQACLSRSGGLTQLPFMLDYEGKVWDEPAGPEAVGYGPLDRIFRTADGWFYLVAESSAAGPGAAAATRGSPRRRTMPKPGASPSGNTTPARGCCAPPTARRG